MRNFARDLKMAGLLKPLVFLGLVNLPIVAQQTWQQLNFGMTVTAAEATLKAAGMELIDVDKDWRGGTIDLQVKPNYKPDSDSSLAKCVFEPTLTFDKASNALKSVYLSLKDIESKYPVKNISNDPREDPLKNILQVAAIEDISKTLVAKYGPRASQQGHCRVTLDEMNRAKIYKTVDSYECEEIWSLPQQTINLKFYLRPARSDLHLSITYSPVPKDL